MKTILTVEESRRLIDLGVDPKLASATRYTISETEEYCGYKREITVTYGYINNYLSADSIFTLADILSILPKEIKTGVAIFHLNIDYPLVNQVAARYVDPDDVDNDILGKMCDEMIDALYHLLIDVIKRGYVQTNKDN